MTVNAINEMKDELIATAAFLDNLANKLDGWARDSKSGSWSTHQVEANQKQADECRRRSAEIRLLINRQPPA